MAEWMGGLETVSIAQLQKALEDKHKELEERDEELQEWKVKCMRAEAEVRALKKQTRHAEALRDAPLVVHEKSVSQPRGPGLDKPRSVSPKRPSLPVSAVDSFILDASRFSPPATPSRRSVRDFGVQMSAMSAEASELAAEAAVTASLRKELQSMNQQKQALETSLESHEEFRAACESQERSAGQSQEVQELRQLLAQRSQAMMQLQSDMVKDKQTVDRQRKEAEILYKEELLEMTQRAKSLSEQAKNSRKRATELQAARDEVAKLGSDIEECEARLSSQESEKARLMESEAKLTSELASSSMEARAALQDHEALSEKLEQRTSELRMVAESSAAADVEKQMLEAKVVTLARTEAAEAERPSQASQLVERALPEASQVGQQADSEVDSKLSLDPGEPSGDAPGEAGTARRKVLECLSSVRQLFTDLQQSDAGAAASAAASAASRINERSPRKPREIGSVKAGSRGQSRGAAPAAGGAAGQESRGSFSSNSGAANKEVMARLTKQLSRLQQLVEGPEGRKALAGQQGGVAAGGQNGGRAAVRAVSPEGEHPPPEQGTRMYQQLSVDANEMMQQQLNDYRVAAEQTREEMMVQHCEELDDLVRRHDRERRELHNEIRDLRAECTQAKAGADGSSSGAADGTFRAQSEQVAIMKREMVAQLSEFHNRETEHRSASEKEISQLRKSLEESTKELAASQEEFEILSELFDNLRREKQQLEAANRVLELGVENLTEKHEVPSLQTDKSDKALIATAHSSYDMTPENTGIWDSRSLNAVPEQLGFPGELPKAHERVSSIHSDRLVASVGSIEKIPETPETVSMELALKAGGPSEKETPSVVQSPQTEYSDITSVGVGRKPIAPAAPARVSAPSRHSAPARTMPIVPVEEAQAPTPSSATGMHTPTPSAVSVTGPGTASATAASSTTVLRAGSRSAVSSLNFTPEAAGALTPSTLSRNWPVAMAGALTTLSSPRATASPAPPHSPAASAAMTVAGAASTLGAARANTSSFRMSGQPVFERRGT
mmetsp:Transcript_72481/g.136901  ORF Transcript_72481/g.136901 Transcript_72481/m.136901 type:complete len:1015 (-) Transcript_72481:152-3196(-)